MNMTDIKETISEGSCVDCSEYFGTLEKDNKCTFCYYGKVGLYSKKKI